MYLKKPAIERKWLLCPHCGMKVLLYDNTANCSGVFVKCTRGCRQTFEVQIRDGEQTPLQDAKK